MPTNDPRTTELKNELVRLTQAGKFKQAEKLFAKTRGKQIDDVELWKLFANVFAQRSKLDRIATCCERILAIEPGDVLTICNYGAVLQNLGRTEDALRQYQRCLELEPAHELANLRCAELLYGSGRIRDSLEYFERLPQRTTDAAVRLNYAHALIENARTRDAFAIIDPILAAAPDNIKAVFLKAQAHYVDKDYDLAEKAYLRVLELDAGNVNALNNLGRLYDETGNYAQAVRRYREAIALDDSIATIHLNLGKTLVRELDLDAAESALQRAVELDPGHPEAYFNLGKIYSQSNRLDDARDALECALNKDVHARMEKPEEFLLAVRYFVSSLDAPDRYDKDKQEYVANLFDNYADKFDDHLVQGLKYRTPELIDQLLEKYASRQDYRCIDLGCGTGLCCRYLRPYSSLLVGVDLSPKMIDKARELDCYDELIVGEVSETMNEHESGFDLVTAADVFVYIGSLHDVFKASQRSMPPGGLLMFSTEKLDDGAEEDFRIYESGRYKHKLAYLERLAAQHGFETLEHLECVLRKENGRDVEGHVSVMRRSG